MVFLLACRNVFSRKSSVVIILFVAFALTMLCVSNSLFDSTEHGIERTFTKSFTGDFFIRPVSKMPLSLFGDETPVTGVLSKNPTLYPFEELSSSLQNNPLVDSFCTQLTCPVLIENASRRVPAFLFGIEGEKYIKQMKAVHIKKGEPFSGSQKGVMLSKKMASALKVEVGSTVQFSVTDGISFRIRAVPITAIYEYEIENSSLEKIALCDAETVLSLLDISYAQETVQLSKEEENLISADFSENLDDLFFNASDFDDVFIKEDFAEENPEIQEEIIPYTTCNFFVCSVKQGVSAKKTIRKMNSLFKKNGWQVQAASWRNAAGSTALYLYWIRKIFSIGILIILFAGFIVINNTLVITILDRISETGTMRAIGASKMFISLECMAETMILSVCAFFLSLILSFIAVFVINKIGLVLTNPFLIQLFGSSAIKLSISVLNIFYSLVLSLILGLIAWIYPVYSGIKVSPVVAMQGAK